VRPTAAQLDVCRSAPAARRPAIWLTGGYAAIIGASPASGETISRPAHRVTRATAAPPPRTTTPTCATTPTSRRRRLRTRLGPRTTIKPQRQRVGRSEAIPDGIW
jgi:hypothetical protein